MSSARLLTHVSTIPILKTILCRTSNSNCSTPSWPSSPPPLQLSWFQVSTILQMLCSLRVLSILVFCHSPPPCRLSLFTQTPCSVCMVRNSHVRLFAHTHIHITACTHATVCTGKYSIVLTDGSNINDICRFSTLTPLRAMAWCLRFRHLFPTAPDTLPCFPSRNSGMCTSAACSSPMHLSLRIFSISMYFVCSSVRLLQQLVHTSPSDPLILTTVPDIFVAANQRDFLYEIYHDTSGKKVLLITLPAFSQSQIAICVQFSTLTVSVLGC
uniref:DNA polymerase delta small subunit n=1 Tax=Lygus hesperus TaxID=30085 RepID=A0A0A9YBQ4_LYGHE